MAEQLRLVDAEAITLPLIPPQGMKQRPTQRRPFVGLQLDRGTHLALEAKLVGGEGNIRHDSLTHRTASKLTLKAVELSDSITSLLTACDGERFQQVRALRRQMQSSGRRT